VELEIYKFKEKEIKPKTYKTSFLALNMEKEKTRIGVFTSPTCPHCPGAIEMVNEIALGRDDLKIEEYSTITPVGSRMAAEQGITSVPTILLNGPGYKNTIAFRGAPSRIKLMSAIDVTRGKKTIDILEDRKEGFFKRIKSLF